MTTPISAAAQMPFWRRPVTLLFVISAAMPIAFSTWSALLNNFVIEVAGFDGSDIGWLHTVREIPGFLAVGVIAIILFMREQVLGLVALVLLGVATAVTAHFPSMGGILTITMLSSIGFHYFETVNQSPATAMDRQEARAADAGLDRGGRGRRDAGGLRC